MSGVGGQGPRIAQDVIVETTFRTISTPSGYTKPFQVSAGLVPNGTFPANLMIGRTVFYTWCFQFGNGSITLTNYLSSPILKPIPQDRAHLFSEPAYKADEPVREGPAKEIKVKWSHNTPTDNARSTNTWRHTRGIFLAYLTLPNDVPTFSQRLYTQSIQETLYQ
ncbi:Uu.00g098110.m01.CDS01 [Anthostomella pinea]|uniref:Uu.00g098110.m01.CDS01 n=1 Tax=Anthostomella pinea TaxID=933095 RepID=A0AAI8VD30_9PEZI|nr:Uu.00g098110.m01.CDS01 [Anthostomella pinea]